MINQQSTASVVAAAVAAELDHARVEATKLSLAAKNARAVVLRAGSAASSLKVISDFFDDLASKTIVLANDINQTAITISKMSVNLWRTQDFYNRMCRSSQLIGEHPRKTYLANVGQKYEHKCLDLESQQGTQIHSLDRQLEEIQQYMRAANVIAVTSRLEATQTGTYERALLTMADNIQSHAESIKHHITESQSILGKAFGN